MIWNKNINCIKISQSTDFLLKQVISFVIAYTQLEENSYTMKNKPSATHDPTLFLRSKIATYI